MAPAFPAVNHPQELQAVQGQGEVVRPNNRMLTFPQPIANQQVTQPPQLVPPFSPDTALDMFPAEYRLPQNVGRDHSDQPATAATGPTSAALPPLPPFGPFIPLEALGNNPPLAQSRHLRGHGPSTGSNPSGRTSGQNSNNKASLPTTPIIENGHEANRCIQGFSIPRKPVNTQGSASYKVPPTADARLMSGPSFNNFNGRIDNFAGPSTRGNSMVQPRGSRLPQRHTGNSGPSSSATPGGNPPMGPYSGTVVRKPKRGVKRSIPSKWRRGEPGASSVSSDSYMSPGVIGQELSQLQLSEASVPATGRNAHFKKSNISVIAEESEESSSSSKGESMTASSGSGHVALVPDAAGKDDSIVQGDMRPT
jgi:hypothetical protein